MKRIVLFLVTNLAVMLVLSVVLNVLGLNRFVTDQGLDVNTLLGFSLVVGFAGSFFSLLISKPVAKWSTGAKVIDGSEGSNEYWLVSTVHRLADQAGIGRPEVAMYEGEPNAFATGAFKNSSLVAVSTGLLQSMSREEVDAVLAHEVSHIANGDMVTLTLIQGVVNAFVMFFSRIIANIVRQMVDEKISHLVFFVTTLVFDIAFGILGSMVVAWFSRAREFRADAGGATLAGKANMIGALQRLMQNKELVDNAQPQLATMKIAGAKGGFMSLISTHPPLEVRIAALQRAQIL